MRANELVLARRREFPIHLDARLRAVLAVLSNDLLVDLLVGVLDLTRVDVLRRPEVAFAVEALKEVALVAPRIAKRRPEPMRRVFGKEPLRNVPDRVRYARRLVKHQKHPVRVVQAGVSVRVLFRPQAPLNRPVPRAFLQITLDQLRDPLGRGHLGCADLEPMTVDCHRQPLGDLGPGDRPELRLTISRHDRR